MERRFVQENATQRERLHTLVATISDRDLERCLPNGWPIYCALAHLAFWDRRSSVLLRKWAREGVTASPIDPQAVNDALLPLFEAIPARLAADLAIAAAETIDRELEQAPEELLAEIAARGGDFRLHRSEHRKRHLDGIQQALATA